MSAVKLPPPINEAQKLFRELCEKGGGAHGGPLRKKVQDLLDWAGKQLNVRAHDEINTHLAHLKDRNPWHVCYAMGLSWGHLARLDLTFTEAAVNALEELNDTDLNTACSFHMERGPDPIRQSLAGGYLLFQKVRLPKAIPTDLNSMGQAQQRWLSRVISPDRPKYIGSWNATAMFMVALFSQPKLAAVTLDSTVLLPPGGPVFAALKTLRKVHILTKDPAGTALDDEAFEPGSLYENNALMQDLLKGHNGWSMLDVHSGLYLLGTRFAPSNEWLK